MAAAGRAPRDARGRVDQIGDNQDEFVDFARRELMPKL